MPEQVMAWHFVGEKLRDGRDIPPDGVELVHEGPLEMCISGLHASVLLIDALRYAPGVTLCRVKCCGAIVSSYDKLVCTRRTIEWRLDTTEVLRAFARQCALDVAHLWEMPDIVRQHLTIGDGSLRIPAWNIASHAASAAATLGTADAALASAAARSATGSTPAALAAVLAADAAAAALAAADYGAVRATQNDRLTAMVMAARK